MKFLEFYSKARSKQLLARIKKQVGAVSAQEAWARGLSGAALQEAFLSLDPSLPPAAVTKGMALVREASRRTLGLRHHDEQLIGGMVLLGRMLAEMQTGEGKTLTIVAPAALQAIAKKGVHVVTANSYLAKRDAQLMRPVYEALGLSVAALEEGMTTAQKQAAYACDVTYGIGSDFGFDYLKDHLVHDASLKVQTRGLNIAIVDEVDAILIDEARVPLIISEKGSSALEVVSVLNACARELHEGVDYLVNLKERNAVLTDTGYRTVEDALVAAGAMPSAEALYRPENLFWVKSLHSAVTAYALYKRNRDYVVAEGKVVLIDSGTGRKMDGRRLGEGVHEALEAREGLEIKEGTVTKASVTYQNFFGLYKSLSGLTGTAITEAEEFAEVYQLETVQVPTHLPCLRQFSEDLVYPTKSLKFSAAVHEVKGRHARGQPVLVGCGSIRDAEVVSRMLAAAGIPHETLTARNVEREAQIIARAGQKNAVTVATNMAGRGTDIHLGGERPTMDGYADTSAYEAAVAVWRGLREEVVKLGGLYVLGTERNGIRRVDNQLAGRCARQGDPGEVRFLMSLEDELLGVFGQNKQLAMVRRAMDAAGSALGGKYVAGLVTQSQKRVEDNGYSSRKQLMQYDKVLSDQRIAVYQLRDALLEGSYAIEYLEACLNQAVSIWAQEHLPEGSLPEQWPLQDLLRSFEAQFGRRPPLLKWVSVEELEAEDVSKALLAWAQNELPSAVPTDIQDARSCALEMVDSVWMAHLQALEELKNNVGLKSHSGLNPMFQFGKDAYALFQGFERGISLAVAEYLLLDHVRAKQDQKKEGMKAAALGDAKVAVELERRWVYRNEPCPCNSGLRFKMCHGSFLGSNIIA